jgi:Integrase core domain
MIVPRLSGRAMLTAASYDQNKFGALERAPGMTIAEREQQLNVGTRQALPAAGKRLRAGDNGSCSRLRPERPNHVCAFEDRELQGRLSDELLKGEIFPTLRQSVIEDWRRHYNRVCPHSCLATSRPLRRLWPLGRP